MNKSSENHNLNPAHKLEKPSKFNGAVSQSAWDYHDRRKALARRRYLEQRSYSAFNHLSQEERQAFQDLENDVSFSKDMASIFLNQESIQRIIGVFQKDPLLLVGVLFGGLALGIASVSALITFIGVILGILVLIYLSAFLIAQPPESTARGSSYEQGPHVPEILESAPPLFEAHGVQLPPILIPLTPFGSSETDSKSSPDALGS
jgi:hypothetical protein